MSEASKDPVNLLDTPFPMRGDLAKREPGFLKKWQDEDIYGQLRAKAKAEGRPAFLLQPETFPSLRRGAGLCLQAL